MSKKINIYYASTAGNTFIVVSHIVDYLTTLGYEAKSFSVLKVQCIQEADAYVFACGTYGHGLLQEHMEKFLFKHNKDFDLHLKSCAAIGLGDNKYDNEYNMESANILDNYITTHNGNICIEPLKINKSPLPHLYNNVETWVQHFIKII